MTMTPPRRLAILYLVGGTILCGCGSGGAKNDKRLKTVNVSGVVTYKGQPVDGATVTFNPGVATNPNAASDGKSAFATTDAQGRYNLGTYATGDGAIPGKYFVTVTKVLSHERKPDPIDEKDYVPPEEGEQSSPTKPAAMIPAKYAATTTSGLLFEVKDAAAQMFDIELKD